MQQTELGQEEEFQQRLHARPGAVARLRAADLRGRPGRGARLRRRRLLPLTLAVAYMPVAFAFQAPAWVFFRRMDFVRQRMLPAIVPLVTLLRDGAAGCGRRRGLGAGDRAVRRERVAVVTAVVVSPYRLRSASTRRRPTLLALLVADLRHGSALLVVQQGQVLAFDINGRPRRGRLHHPRRDAHPLRRSRRPDRDHHDLSGDLRRARPQGTLEELFEKSNRATLAIWALPFCAGLVLFAPDLVEFVLGDEVGAGGRAAAGAGRDGGDPAARLQLDRLLPRAWQLAAAGVESAVLLGGFLALAVPALFAGASTASSGGGSPCAGRCWWWPARCLRAGAAAGRAARRLAARVRAGGGRRRRRRSRCGSRSGAASGPALQAVAELALFLGVTLAITVLSERGLLTELRALLAGRNVASSPERERQRSSPSPCSPAAQAVTAWRAPLRRRPRASSSRAARRSRTA